MKHTLAAAALVVLWAAFTPVLQAQDPVVYRVSLNGNVELSAFQVVARALKVAAEGAGAVVILEIGSPGGRYDAAQLIVADVEASTVPVYVMVTQHAWGPAAMVALAGDSMFMGPESFIGAGRDPAGRRSELSAAAQSAVTEDFRALAVKRGFSEDVGVALATESDGTAAPFTLSAPEAVTAGVARAQIANVADLLARIGLSGTEVITVDAGWTGTTIEIENYNTRDVRITVLRGGTRYILGQVTSMRVATFEIPISHLSDGAQIRVLAEVIGSSDRRTTDVIRVEPGLVVRWMLADPLRYSSFSHFVRYY